MRDANIARVWAQALLELSTVRKCLGPCRKGIDVVLAAMSDEPTLVDFLASPRIPADTKKTIFAKAFKGEIDPVYFDFLGLLVDRGRGPFFKPILERFRDLYNEATGRARARVWTAVPLTAQVEKKVTRELEKLFGKTIDLDSHVDPAVLGGLVVQVGDTRIDGSLQRELKEIRARLLGLRINTEVVYADQDG